MSAAFGDDRPWRGAMAKELFLTALIGLALTVPLVSYQTVDAVGGLQLESRWGSTAVVIVALVLGRLGIILLRTPGYETYEGLGWYGVLVQD